MAFSLRQYIHAAEDTKDCFTQVGGDDKYFCLSYENQDQGSFVDVGTTIIPIIKSTESGLEFEADQNYFFHGKIKQLTTEQNFIIQLSKTITETQQKTYQYIKSIRVVSGDGWIDVAFSFVPLEPFTTLEFFLQRRTEDFQGNSRVSLVYPIELCKYKNLVSTISGGAGDSFIKIGIHSNPGLKMYINGSEIMVGNSGVYELDNPAIRIDFFNVYGIDEYPQWEQNWKDNKTLHKWLDDQYDDAIIQPEPLDVFNDLARSIQDSSGIARGEIRTRTINSYLLDYILEENN